MWDWTNGSGALAAWVPISAALALLFAIAAVELLWPLHRRGDDGAGRMTANFGLGLINITMVSLMPVTGVAAAQWARLNDFGLLHLLDAPAAASIGATIAARSLLAYGLHRLAHRSALLWRFHDVHHRDTAMDVSTGFRHHPVEALYITLASAAVAAALGATPEVLAAYELFAAAIAAWVHANHRLPAGMDRMIGWVLATPALHHVHHSAHQPETDSNFGDTFILWDRLFGTYRRLAPAELANIRFGLGDSCDGTAASLLAQLAAPLPSRRRAVDPAPGAAVPEPSEAEELAA